MVCRGRHFCRALQVYVRLFPFLTWTALPSLGKQHDASRLLAPYVHGIAKGREMVKSPDYFSGSIAAQRRQDKQIQDHLWHNTRAGK